VDDPEPYTATEVRRVLFSVPGAARVVQWFSDPYVLGGLTLGATALVIWAFWPRTGEGDPPEGGDDAEQDGAEGPPASHSPERAVHPIRAGGRGLGAVLLVATLLAAPGPAHAETVQISGAHLRLQSTGDPAQMQNLQPGVPVVWQVGIWAEAPDPGRIDLALTSRGALAEARDAVTLTVLSCSERWTTDRCPAGSHELLSTESLDRLTASGLRPLTSFPSDEQRWLRITVELRDDSPRLAGAEADVLLRATGAGDDLEITPDEPGGDAPDGAGSGSSSPGEEAPDEAASDIGLADVSADGALARTGAVGVWALLATALLVSALGISLRGAAERRPEARGRVRP
jgi:hypothetical protein